MNRLSTEDGQAKYGSRYISYYDLILQHACLFAHPNCDVGHVGPHFGIVHRAILLQFENSLLAIDPKILAMPYWNVAFDSVTGKYRRDPEKYMFSSKNFGSYIGDPKKSYAIVDGIFKFWRIQQYNDSTSKTSKNRCIREKWFKPPGPSTCPRCCGKGSWCVCSKEEKSLVLLRGNNDCSPYMTRNYNLLPLTTDGIRDYKYTKADFDACTNRTNIRSITAWQRCIEVERIACLTRGSNPDLSALGGRSWIKNKTLEYIKNDPDECAYEGFYTEWDSGKRQTVNALHTTIHAKIAGEFRDPYTSPNDPLFFNFHSDIDRNLMTWQVDTPRLLAKYWRYPYTQTVWPRDRTGSLSAPFSAFSPVVCAIREPEKNPAYSPFKTPWPEGILLDDIINDGFRFRDLFGDGSGKSGHTFRQIISKTAPNVTPYTYDTLEHHYARCRFQKSR